MGQRSGNIEERASAPGAPGGEVKAAEIPEDGQARGIVTEIISLAVMAVSSAREEALYEPATEYDVWLRCRPDGVAEEAAFVRRETAAETDESS